ncbi:MAG: thioredoxin family protein [Flavobacteriaceae bacterium]|nr:thioredoxin family protein [Flavobacteriaceae bacterium]
MKNKFYTNRPLFVALLMSFATMFISCKSTTNKKENTRKTAETTTPFIKDVSPKEFKKLIDSGDVILLDVRTSEEVAQGQIEGSSSINFYDEDFVEKINLINKSKVICVYCRSGNRSSKAAKIMQENGFNRIYNLDGGTMAWSQNLPLTKPTTEEDKHIKAMSLADFEKMLKTDLPVLVDFHTLWCSPCRKMAPIMDKIEEEYKGKAVVIRIDVDKSKEIAKAYNIKGVPVFILFKNGTQKWKHNGLISKKELISQIENNK